MSTKTKKTTSKSDDLDKTTDTLAKNPLKKADENTEKKEKPAGEIKPDKNPEEPVVASSTRKKREKKTKDTKNPNFNKDLISETYPEIADIDHSYELCGTYLLKKELFKVLEWTIQRGKNILLIGDSGDGKTELPYYIAQALKIPITSFDMGTMTDAILGLVGAHVIKTEDGKPKSVFVKSRFVNAIQQPGIILLDELSRAEHSACNILFPALDFRRHFSMEYCFDDSQLPINVHPQCIFWATANVGAEYSGVKKIDRALLDRFLPIEVDPLTEEQLLHISRRYQLSEEAATKIIDAYLSIRIKFAKFELSYQLSPRSFKQICEFVQDGFTIYDAFYIICKGIGGKKGIEEAATLLSEIKKK
ncbi:MAG: AAA family ATPase [Bacteroidales bacterium]|nr:AAA family ATPase [Bacteroidales bacterium]